MKPKTAALLLALAAIISGCSGPAAEPASTSTEPGGTSIAADETTNSDPEADAVPVSKTPFFDFVGCSEVNLVFTFPAEDFDAPGPLTLKKDATGLFINGIITIMACDSLDSSGRKVEKPIAVFGLLPVEKYEPLKLDGINGYYFLGFAATSQPEIRSVLRARGVDIDKATLTIKWDQIGGNAKARASFEGKVDDFQVAVESAMAGSPAGGAAGALGLYTYASKKNRETLWVHQVNFTAYKYYDKGAATVTPAFLPLPGLPGVLEFPQPTPAYHNIDYGARFDFDRGILEK